MRPRLIQTLPMSNTPQRNNAWKLLGKVCFTLYLSGRVRIRNVLKTLVGLSSKSDPAVDEAVGRLLSTRVTL